MRIRIKRRTIEARLQQRARVILLAAQGWQNKDIAVEIDLDRRQVALWRSRFLQGGIDALRQDAPRSGRTPTVTAEVESKILEVTLHSKPAAATHRSTRTLAAHLGIDTSLHPRPAAHQPRLEHAQAAAEPGPVFDVTQPGALGQDES